MILISQLWAQDVVGYHLYRIVSTPIIIPEKTNRARHYTVAPYLSLEMDLMEWNIDFRSNGMIVTQSTIKVRALMMVKDKILDHGEVYCICMN